MKKNHYELISGLCKIWESKFLKRMRIVALLLLISITQTFALDTYAQNKRLSLNVKNETILNILEKLEDRSEFYFMFDASRVKVNQRKSVDCENKPIRSILDQLFEDTGIGYSINDRQILLTTIDNSIVEQQKTIFGKVSDSSGSPLPGVTVVVKGTTQGTITDADGNYSISNIPDDAILQFSFVGMKTQEIAFVGQTSINITLAADAIGIEEVVALGYTTEKKKNMIGSVAKISTEELISPAYSNFKAALQGKAAGLYVSQDKIRIRGINSISLSSEPLWVIDGIIGDGSNLNQNDIESITVLKDAAATALYGSSGANGVIVVTTKTMSKGGSKLSVIVNTGFESFIGKGYPTVNTSEYFEIMDESKLNASNYSGEEYIPFDPNKAFDWNSAIPGRLTRAEAEAINTRAFDDATDVGRYSEIYLSATENLKKGQVYFSLTYRDNNGQIKGKSSDKLVGRLGINYTPLKNLDVHLNTTNTLTNGITSGAELGLSRPPIMPLYDETDITGYWSPGDNPLVGGDSRFREDSYSNFSSTTYLKSNYQIPFVKGLSVGTVLKVGFNGRKDLDWYAEELLAENFQSISKAREIFYFSNNYLYRGQIDYNRSFNQHSISAIILAEASHSYSNNLSAEGTHLNGSYHLLGTPGSMKSMGSSRVESTSIAYIGRVSYNYKGRYLLEGNIRRDGISLLAENNRWSTFPSVGMGWILSDESFFNIPQISLLKIRGSIGKTGNAAVPQFAYASTYTINSPSGTTYDTYNTSYIKNLASDIEWETSDNLDIGFDFGLFSNKINGSVAYFNKKISGLLLQVPIPPSTGIVSSSGNTVWDNIGNMENSGIELDLNISALRKIDFSWDISLNLSTNKNEILALSPSVDVKGEGIYGNNSWTLTKKGEKLATYYLPEFAGIDTDKGIPMIWERDAQLFAETGETKKTGNRVPATSLNEGRNQILQSGKSSLPDLYGGINNTLRYKDLSLNIVVTYAGGHYFIDQRLSSLTNAGFGSHTKLADLMADSWQNPGDNAKYGELIYNNGFYYDDEGNATTVRSTAAGMTTQFLKKADNIQLKTLTLTYSLKRLVSKTKISDLQVYANINNVAYWSKAGKWHHPEEVIGPNVDGYTRLGALMTRTYSIGFSVNF